MTRTPPDRARRMDEARRSLKAAMITISHAQTAALAVAAIRGMDKALRADWMDPRGGE